MTTTSQQTVLTAEELTCLSDFARGHSVEAPVMDALAAKGMLQLHGGVYVLTPAAQHALHAGEPGTVPGVDN